MESVYGLKKQQILSFHQVLLRVYSDFIQINECIIGDKRVSFFDGSWSMQLGGVETWIRGLLSEFERRQYEDIYLLTDLSKSDIPREIENRTIDYHCSQASLFLEEEIKKGIDFLIDNLPCNIVFK